MAVGAPGSSKVVLAATFDDGLRKGTCGPRRGTAGTTFKAFRVPKFGWLGRVKDVDDGVVGWVESTSEGSREVSGVWTSVAVLGLSLDLVARPALVKASVVEVGEELLTVTLVAVLGLITRGGSSTDALDPSGSTLRRRLFPLQGKSSFGTEYHGSFQQLDMLKPVQHAYLRAEQKSGVRVDHSGKSQCFGM